MGIDTRRSRPARPPPKSWSATTFPKPRRRIHSGAYAADWRNRKARRSSRPRGFLGVI